MTAHDAHLAVQAALGGSDVVGCGPDAPGLHDLRLADLNESEIEAAGKALHALHTLDAQLAERTGAGTVDRPSETSVNRGDEE